MKSLIMIWTLLFGFGCVQLSFAQAPETLWTRTYGGDGWDVGNSVQQTIDGGYIITGTTSSYGAGNDDVWLIKTDASGDTLWTKTYGGEDSEGGETVQQTNDGGYILAGTSVSLGDRVWLIKTDASGDTLWSKTFEGRGWVRVGSVQQTTDVGYFMAVAHLTWGFSVLIKTDSKGDTVWTKSFQGYCLSGIQTVDGGYIIAGGYDDVMLIKTDELGDTLWTRTFRESGHDIGWSVKQTTDGGYIIAGSTNFDESVRLIKTDESGDTLWTKTYEGKRGGYSVQQTTDGGYIIAAGPCIIKTDVSGDTLWTYEGAGFSQSVQQTTDDGYIIAGFTGSDTLDVWLIKLVADPVDYIIHDENALPEKYELCQNYPNPFNPKTVIRYSVGANDYSPVQHVDLSIYNVLGQKVVTLVNKKQPAGSYQVQWDGIGFATGVYYYKIEAGEYSEVKKMILIR